VRECKRWWQQRNEEKAATTLKNGTAKRGAELKSEQENEKSRSKTAMVRRQPRQTAAQTG
jgi:hypothetical protein